MTEQPSDLLAAAGEFDRVAADLAESGYDFSWTCQRASDIGAPHRRERLFVVATDSTVAGSQGCNTRSGRYEPLGECGRQDRRPKLMPTPRARDGHGTDSNPQGGPCLPSAVADTERWGDYAPVIRRWESLTRPAPDPTEFGVKGNVRINPAFSEWMMGWPAGWVTDVPGITRGNQLRIIGNGVVPQQAIAALCYLIEAGVAA